MINQPYLEHHGILGMKWGVRRYQNEDGTLTAAGKARYLNEDGSLNKTGQKELSKSYTKMLRKNQKAAAKASGNAYVSNEYEAKLRNKANKLSSKGKDEKAKKYTQKADRQKLAANDYAKDCKASQEAIQKTKDLVNQYGDFMITSSRDVTDADFTTSDGATLSVNYDKSKVRMNTEENKKKFAHNREVGYDYVKTWTYYYFY